MTPLDLFLRPPRGPRERLAGIAFTARLVDKLRASLSGGNLNGYLPTTGFSLLWAYYTRIDLDQLRGVVEVSASEGEVERWISDRTGDLDKDKINAKMARFDSSRTPAEDLEEFARMYPAELRARHTNIFDLLEADDAWLYGAPASSRTGNARS
jgi:hypothetical protein